MPSHIFTRLGYWQESIDTNRASVEAAKEELRQANLEAGSYNALHAMDYIAYAALQLGKDKEAKAVLDEVRRIEKIDTEHFAAAFAFAAIPARYTLERRQWADAAELTLHPQNLSWQKFPQAESILWFARGVGAARAGNAASAKGDLARLEALRDRLTAVKNAYWAEQAEIQRLGVAAWIARAERRDDEAVALMRKAADLEAATEKHPVTPGAILPAREMLGELLLQLGQPAKALAEFEASMRTDPNRFQGLVGAARAAEQSGDRDRARKYYTELVSLARTADSERSELVEAKKFLAAGR
jgi:tetratricopeptide (TPR) repeat protein